MSASSSQHLLITDAASLKSKPAFFSGGKRGLCKVPPQPGLWDGVRRCLGYGEPAIEDWPALYYEIHGHGPRHVCLIMGLNGSHSGWAAQVERFSEDPAEYTLLLMDNMGVGNSDTPLGPYSTQNMAANTVHLLDSLGWTDKASFHLVGISMGGMLAQYVALAIPSRLISLTLIVTTPGNRFWWNFPPFKGVMALARLTFEKDMHAAATTSLNMLYPEKFLKKINDKFPEKTNEQVFRERLYRRMKHSTPQTLNGSLSQMLAALRHGSCRQELYKLSTIPKVLLLTGTEDHLVDPRGSYELRLCIPESELVIMDSYGHGVLDHVNPILERVFEEGETALRSKSLKRKSGSLRKKKD